MVLCPNSDKIPLVYRRFRWLRVENAPFGPCGRAGNVNAKKKAKENQAIEGSVPQ